MSDCPTKQFFAPKAEIGGLIAASRCLPAPARIPNELVEPENPLEPIVILERLGPITLYNLSVTVRCASPSTGPDVSVPYGKFSETYYWNAGLGLSDEDVARLVHLDINTWLAAQLYAETLTPESMAMYTGLPRSTCAAVVASLNEALGRLNETARVYAAGLLRCRWGNTLQRATCPDPDMARPYDYPGAVYEAIVPANTIYSDLSQEDADALALQQAQSMLNCLYENDDVLVNCVDYPGAAEPPMEPVPTDAEPVYPGLPLRVGSYTVRRGTFASTESRAAANAEARAFGYGQLVCFYVNDLITVYCTDPNARGEGVDPTTTDPAMANPETGSRGQIVTIPRGFSTSVLSTEDANAQARILADSLLECCYINKELSGECPPVLVVDEHGNPVLGPDGQPIYVQADPGLSDQYSYVIKAGTYTSCVSQEDADAQAEMQVQGLLNCIYCNRIVLPSCVPSWVLEAVTAGVVRPDGTLYKVDLPLEPSKLIDPYTGVPVDISQWSVDATAGVPAGVYCSSNYEESQQVADSSTLPLRELDVLKECVFQNDEVVGACSSEDPYGGGGRKPNGEPYIFVSKFPAGTSLSRELSSPIPGEIVIVPAGTISVTASDVPGTKRPTDDGYDPDYNDRLTKAYANAQAVNLIMTMMTCVFGHPKTIAWCDHPEEWEVIGGTGFPYMPDPYAQLWQYGAGKLPDNLFEESHTADDPLVVGKDTFISTKSQQEVVDELQQFLASSLLCIYYNDEQQAFCPPDMEYNHGGITAARAILARTKDEANAIALFEAQTSLDCTLPGGGGGGEPGPPGPQGPPGDPGPSGPPSTEIIYTCSGSCFGVYT